MTKAKPKPDPLAALYAVPAAARDVIDAEAVRHRLVGDHGTPATISPDRLEADHRKRAKVVRQCVQAGLIDSDPLLKADRYSSVQHAIRPGVYADQPVEPVDLLAKWAAYRQKHDRSPAADHPAVLVYADWRLVLTPGEAKALVEDPGVQWQLVRHECYTFNRRLGPDDQSVPTDHATARAELWHRARRDQIGVWALAATDPLFRERVDQVLFDERLEYAYRRGLRWGLVNLGLGLLTRVRNTDRRTYTHLCQPCRLARIQAEYEAEVKANEVEERQRDAEKKAEGYTCKVVAWLHPAAGEDREVVVYFDGNPSKQDIVKHLKMRGCQRGDDFVREQL